jgi:hypothetical protein
VQTLLRPLHPLHLAIALNFSAFHYDDMDDQQSALDIGKQALFDAMADIDVPPLYYICQLFHIVKGPCFMELDLGNLFWGDWTAC